MGMIIVLLQIGRHESWHTYKQTCTWIVYLACLAYIKYSVLMAAIITGVIYFEIHWINDKEIIYKISLLMVNEKHTM